MYYIDTNVWIYAVTAHPKYGPACKDVLDSIEKKGIRAMVSTQVLSEVVGVLYRYYKVKDTTLQIDAILSYPIEAVVVTPDVVRRGAEYARDYNVLPYDGIHVAIASKYATNRIISADRELDKIDFVERIDPLEMGRKPSRP